METNKPIVRAPAMQALVRFAEKVAPSRASVLINGETGTGKEVMARHIHRHSQRAAGPFTTVNCGAIPSTLVESMLFGHEKGAFTGAMRRSSGAFESADGGTLFLDEIGELPLDAQTRLLRVLDSRRISRIGSSSEIDIDIRVVTATHRDLESMVAEGSFREDLYYRINVVKLELPPLRDRREDIIPIAESLMERFSNALSDSFEYGEKTELMTTQGQSECPPQLELTEDSKASLYTYDWPGNVRELRNAIEYATLFAEDGRIHARHLPDRVTCEDSNDQDEESSPESHVVSSQHPDCPKNDTPEAQANESHTGIDRASNSESPVPDTSTTSQTLNQRLAAVEARFLLEALEQVRWNRRDAATLLGVPVRTLAWKLTKHKILRTNGTPTVS